MAFAGSKKHLPVFFFLWEDLSIDLVAFCPFVLEDVHEAPLFSGIKRRRLSVAAVDSSRAKEWKEEYRKRKLEQQGCILVHCQKRRSGGTDINRRPLWDQSEEQL